MRQIKSDRKTFIDFIKSEVVREYFKRILFVLVMVLIVYHAVAYVSSLPVKVDPLDILTMNCTVTRDTVTVNVKEWVDKKEPEKKPLEIKCRYDDMSHTLYISLIMSDEGEGEAYKEFPIDNEFGNIKKVVVEGGILNIHQRTIWDDGEELIASVSDTSSKLKKSR